MRALAQSAREVVLLAPNSAGEVDGAALAEAVTPDTAMVSLMAANNETGVLTDIEAVMKYVRKVAPHALLHTDAAQLAGKGEVNFERLGVDLLTLSAHKIGGLSGVGAIVVRPGIDLAPLLRGGPQEGKVRAGTENVLGIVAFGVVAELVRTQLAERIASMRRMRDEFERLLLTSLPECAIQGAAALRLPNTSSVYIPGIRGDDLVVALDLQGILISSGAACSSGKPEPSHVLLAMGVGEAQARSTVRVSFRADHPPQVAATVVAAIERVVARTREAERGR
jgi:cysteine desulfurase